MLNLLPEELKSLSKKDRMVLKYMSELERVNENPRFREYMSAEEDNRKIENSLKREYTEKGIKESSISTAKAMLKDGVDIDKIIKYTSLSKEDIGNLR